MVLCSVSVRRAVDSSMTWISSVNLMPKSHLLIQGASGFGGTEVLNSEVKTDSSTFGIMLGGLTNGSENEGLV